MKKEKDIWIYLFWKAHEWVIKLQEPLKYADMRDFKRSRIGR